MVLIAIFEISHQSKMQQIVLEGSVELEVDGGSGWCEFG